MKKFLFILFGVFGVMGAFAAGENIPTSKSYVDAAVAPKQDTIEHATGAPMVLTNTGMAGEYGTKGIYNSTGTYAGQTQNLVDAATMNAGVQNAINSEFQCIEWDEHGECLLLDLSVARYAQYDIYNGFKNSRLFGLNAFTQISFSGDTKISTIKSTRSDSGAVSATIGRGTGSSCIFCSNGQNGNYINGHKYYFYAKMRKTVSSVTSVRIYRDTRSSAYFKNMTTEWNVHDVIFQTSFADDSNTHYTVIGFNAPEGEGIMIDQNYVGLYDLTKIFGAGNEPATPDAAARALLLLHMPATE